MALTLSDDTWAHVGLHLKPRHLSKLLRTCKRVNRVVDNEAYWTRVVAHLVLRESYLADIDRPCGEKVPYCEYLPAADPSLYFMVGLEQSYYQSMQCFLQRIPDMLVEFVKEGGAYEQALAAKTQGLTLEQLTLDCAMRKWTPDSDGMKGFAKAATIEFWVTDKTKRYDFKWPKLQRFLIDMEDDPMPVVYKRRIFRKMYDALGDCLHLYCGLHTDPSVGSDLCIF
jgi:hypothetical protein